MPIDGAPVAHPVAGTPFTRVINTRALILGEPGGGTYYLHVYDGWLYAGAMTGPWYRLMVTPPGIDQVAQNLARAGVVDLLDGQGATPKPSLAQVVPVIYVSADAGGADRVQGPPTYESIAGTALRWASNTTADVIFDTGGQDYYVLLSGRWYRAAALNGPWTYVASTALPADFRRIPVELASGRGPGRSGRDAAGARGRHREHHPADGDDPAREWPDVLADLRRPPELRPIPGTPL